MQQNQSNRPLKIETTNVHDALQKAVMRERERKSSSASEVVGVKVQAHKKQLAKAICEQHGTTLSAFLRECVDGLLTDYSGQDLDEACDVDEKA